MANRTRPATRDDRQVGERRARPSRARSGRARGLPRLFFAELAFEPRLSSATPSRFGLTALAENCRPDRKRFYVRRPSIWRRRRSEPLRTRRRPHVRLLAGHRRRRAAARRTRMVHITEYACFHTGLLHAWRHRRTGIRHARWPNRRGHLLRPPLSGYTSRARGRRRRPCRRPAGRGGGEWPEGLYEAEMRVAAFQQSDLSSRCGPRRAKRQSIPDLQAILRAANLPPTALWIARAPLLEDHVLFAESISRERAVAARRLTPGDSTARVVRRVDRAVARR